MESSQPNPATPSSYSAYNIPIPSRRMPPASRSSMSLEFPHSETMHNLASHDAQVRGSRTWTTSSGDLGLMSDTDEVEDRTVFVQEYNRLAKNVRMLIASWKQGI